MIKKLLAALSVSVLLFAPACSSLDFGSPISETVVKLNPDGSVKEQITTEHNEVTYYHKSIAQSDEAKALAVAAQAEAISKVVTETEMSGDAKALVAHLASERIASLKVDSYSGKAPTTGVDVAMKVAEVVPHIVTGTVIGYGIHTAGNVLESMVESDRGTQVTADNGSTVTVEQVRNDATAIGSSQANAGASGNTGPVKDNESESINSNGGGSTVPSTGEVPAVMTEEYCNSQGMTLRESMGVCITWADKAAIEAAAAAEEEAN